MLRDEYDIQIEFGDRYYDAALQRLNVEGANNSSFFSFRLNKNLYDKQYGYLRYLNDKKW